MLGLAYTMFSSSYFRLLYVGIIRGDKKYNSLMEQLQILQNKIAKIILDAPFLSSPTKARSKLNWCLLAHRRYLHRMFTIYTLANSLIDFDLNLPKTNRLYNTRNKSIFVNLIQLEKAEITVPGLQSVQRFGFQH